MHTERQAYGGCLFFCLLGFVKEKYKAFLRSPEAAFFRFCAAVSVFNGTASQ